MPECLGVLDHSLKFLALNRVCIKQLGCVAERLVGFKPDEARGVSAFDFGQLLAARDNSEVLEGRGKLCLGDIDWQVA